MENFDEPTFFSIGTEVIAKYKGAFCEAKIKNISKFVKCKVQFLNGKFSFVSDEAVKGPLKVGAAVKIKNYKEELEEATIRKIQDHSQYIVVFNDGGIKCLKRKALCLKSKRHLAASSSLDQLPLTHPEHNITLNDTNTARGCKSPKEKKSLGDNIEEMVEFDVGRVVCVETNDKKKVKDNWFPGLIVAHTAQTSIKTDAAKEYLIRSFIDGKYFTVQKKASLKEYTSEIGAKVDNPTLKTAIEKTQLYITKDELPPHWDRDLLFGTDKCLTDNKGVCDNNKNYGEESIEEKDHFIAQLFKFMDDRGTPLNDLPIISDKDLDLFQLFKVVNILGGFNKVSKNDRWHIVALKMGESNMNEDQASACFKKCYQLFLQSFEEFHRKLGCTMMSSPRGFRSHSRFSRKIIRDIDKALPSTSSSTDMDKQSSVKQEPNSKKDKPKIVKEYDTFKDPVISKKTIKDAKSGDKSSKINHKSIKKDVKEKYNINTTTTSFSKSVNSDSNILDSKDSKTKKGLNEPYGNDRDIEKILDKEPMNNVRKHFFGKNAWKIPKKENLVKVKPTETIIPTFKNVSSIKEQMKTFVEVLTPFSKSKGDVSNTPPEFLQKTKLNEDVPKLTQSKSNQKVPDKSKRVSILSDSVVGSVTLQSGPSESVDTKIKKEDGSEKEKPVQKKKDEKNDNITFSGLNTLPISSEAETSMKDPPSDISIGDHIVVFYGNDNSTTYDAKILKTCMVKGVLMYLVHYKGWNSRHDEWVESSRTALISKGSAQEPEHDETNSLKNVSKNIDSKKPILTNTTKQSATPSSPNLNQKKSPFSSDRPIVMCTLKHRLLSSIYNSDSEIKDTIGNLKPTKHYKRSQQIINSIKHEQEDIIIKPVSAETDNKKKMYPKTYPSKKVLMQRNVTKKPKFSEFKVHSDESEEVKICKQITHKPSFEYNFEIPPPSNVIKTNLNNKNEPEIALYLSPKKESEIYSEQNQSISETQNSIDEIEYYVEYEILSEEPYNTDIFYPSSSEKEEQRRSEQMSSNNDKPDDSKMSGADFDHRPEMNDLMLSSTNSSNFCLNHSTESTRDLKVTEIPKSIDPIADVYELTEYEPCGLENIPFIKEKQQKVIKHIDNPPKLLNCEQPDELSNAIRSISPLEAVGRNEPISSFVSDMHSDSFAFDNNVDIKEKLNINDEIESSDFFNKSDNEFNASDNLIIHDISTNINRVSQNKICHVELDETEIKNKSLDLCIKPPESPPSNIFSIPEPNETNNIEEDDDNDELKLVIIENDFHMDANQILGEENSFSNEPYEIIQTSSPPPPSSSIHQLPCTDSKLHSSYGEQRNNKKDIVDERRTTSCNENIQNIPIESFQMYSNFKNQSIIANDCINKNRSDGIEFNSNSNSPAIDTIGIIELTAKLSIYESINSNLVNNITDNLYDSIPRTSENGCSYETSIPCSSKSFNNPYPGKNNVFFCEETTPGSPTGISEDHYDHEEKIRVTSQATYERIKSMEAASTMFSLKESYNRPMTTLMGVSENEIIENNNTVQNDRGESLDQSHLQMLTETSSKNLIMNEPTVMEPSSEGITKSPKKSHKKRKKSNHENSQAKRTKISSTALTTSEIDYENPNFEIPLIGGKPLITFTPDMDSEARQTLILRRMNELREEYISVKARISVIGRKRKKINKRKKKLAALMATRNTVE